jgi:hypothetical protein
MVYQNRNEVCVAALQRSGHHAIINWIVANSAAPACFLNDCRPNLNPFLTCAREDETHLSPKNLLIYNYEDHELKELFTPEFMDNRSRWFGKSKCSTHVLIIRDPFNNFASKYRWAINGTKWTPQMEWITRVLPGLWKAYAKEFLGLTNFIPAPKILLDYNRWFADVKYREDTASRLELGSADKGLTEVAKWGPNTWGDSFDNMKFDGRAHEMKVFERWRYFADDPVFRDLFRDSELLSLSQEIFGVIPGTDLWLR